MTREQLLGVALDAIARTLDSTAHVTNPRYRDDRMEYIFDLMREGQKVETLVYCRKTVDDLLDAIIGALPQK